MNIQVIRAQSKDTESEHDSVGLDESIELQPPRLYQVILLNDDYTPMEFVVEVLQLFFAMTDKQAEQVMLQVHEKGEAVCSIFPREIAETKSALINEYARDSGHPLLSKIEPE